MTSGRRSTTWSTSWSGPVPPEFFKARYLQWELVDLSRRILFTGVPALIASVAALYLKPGSCRGRCSAFPCSSCSSISA